MACISVKAEAVASLDAVSPLGNTAATGTALLTCLVIDESSRPWGACLASLDSLPRPASEMAAVLRICG
jgi:hypothetical protein